jgi:hypothetical protein
MECSDYDPEFRLSSTAGATLGSFLVAPNLMYAFLLAHCAEIPALSRDARLAASRSWRRYSTGTSLR